MALIDVKELKKEFRVLERKPGLVGAVQNLFSRRYQHVKAVDGISFEVEPGEIVGFIGPNGAGKSTTIKMLTGILRPSDGLVTVDGIDPHRQRRENAKKIGVVFGQRSQLWWDLAVADSFDLLRHIYDIPKARYGKSLEQLDGMLGLSDFMERPVRSVSLGQRMRADFAAAMLHEPKLLYLDEPTIGLDIVAKDQVRAFLLDINRERNTTIFLTTHDLADINQLCTRVMVIDHGNVIFSGTLQELKCAFGGQRKLVVDLESEVDIELPNTVQLKAEGRRRWLGFSAEEQSAAVLIQELARRYPVVDLSIEEPDIEDVVRKIYLGEATSK